MKNRSPFLFAVALLVTACGDPAEFRPARGVKDLPAQPTSYRVPEPSGDCESLGYVVHAKSLDAIAETVASHGGTHYFVLNDQSSTSIETNGTAARGFGGAVNVSTSSYAVKHHSYTAQAYRCD